MAGADRRRPRRHRAVPRDGHRLPVLRQPARHPRRATTSPARPTTRASGPMRASTSRASGSASSAPAPRRSSRSRSSPSRPRHLTVFQRTATYSVPAWNGPLDPDEVAKVKANYARVPRGEPADAQRVRRLARPPDQGRSWRPPPRSAARASRSAGHTAACPSSAPSTTSSSTPRPTSRPPSSSATASARRHGPRGGRAPHPRPGHRLQAPLRRHRLLRDVQPPERPPRRPERDADRARSPPPACRRPPSEHEVDSLIFATGFDAMTGALLRIDIRGRDGERLQDAWAAGPRTYLGLGVTGFPNLFTITGPGSPSVLTNMIVSIQQHVEWIGDCIAYLRDHGHQTIEAEEQAQDELGGLRERRRRLHALPHLQLLVPRRQRAREDPGVHAPARLRHLRRAVRLTSPPRATRASLRWPHRPRRPSGPAAPGTSTPSTTSACGPARPVKTPPTAWTTRSCSATSSSCPTRCSSPSGPSCSTTGRAGGGLRRRRARHAGPSRPAARPVVARGPGPSPRPDRRARARRAVHRVAPRPAARPRRGWWRRTRRTSTSTCSHRSRPAAGAGGSWRRCSTRCGRRLTGVHLGVSDANRRASRSTTTSA